MRSSGTFARTQAVSVRQPQMTQCCDKGCVHSLSQSMPTFMLRVRTTQVFPRIRADLRSKIGDALDEDGDDSKMRLKYLKEILPTIPNFHNKGLKVTWLATCCSCVPLSCQMFATSSG